MTPPASTVSMPDAPDGLALPHVTYYAPRSTMYHRAIRVPDGSLATITGFVLLLAAFAEVTGDTDLAADDVRIVADGGPGGFRVEFDWRSVTSVARPGQWLVYRMATATTQDAVFVLDDADFTAALEQVP